MDEARDMLPADAEPAGTHRLLVADSRPRMWAAVILLLAALAMLVGCGTGGTTSSGIPTGTATSKLCERIITINQTLTQLATVGDNTTVGEVKALQQKLSTALDALDKLPGAGGPTLSQLQDANDQLEAAIKDLPDDATVGQVGPRLQDFKGKVSNAQAAASKLASALHCSG